MQKPLKVQSQKIENLKVGDRLGIKGRVGHIIYPHYNGTASFWKKSRWDLVLEIDKDGKVIHIRCIWDYATVQAIEAMQELYKLSLKPKNDNAVGKK